MNVYMTTAILKSRTDMLNCKDICDDGSSATWRLLDGSG